MYAIVEIAGQQFKVKKDQKVYVHRLDAKEGANIEFGNVLLTGNGDKITVGTPSIDGARVAAKVLGHMKGDKVIVFKKKRRKGYQKSNGHRQFFSQILVQGILGKGETFKEEAQPAKAAKPKKEAAVENEAEMPVAEKKAAPKKAAAKKTAEPKAAAKKATPKKAAKKKED